MTEKYRLMVYFAIATLHLYRKDLSPPVVGESTEMTLHKNMKVVERVVAEGLNTFGYELSSTQIERAIYAYFADSQSIATHAPYSPTDRTNG
jgi:hypothetical protein